MSQPDTNVKILLTLPAGILLFLIFGEWKLALAYAIVWLDKIPLDIIYVRTGINAVFAPELITISILFVGMNYSPTAAFLFAFFVPLVLGSVRQFAMPADAGPPFAIPSLQNFVDGIIGVVSNMLKSQGLFMIMIVAMAIKHPLNIIIERATNPEKPIEINAISKIIVNLALASYLQDWSIFMK